MVIVVVEVKGRKLRALILWLAERVAQAPINTSLHKFNYPICYVLVRIIVLCSEVNATISNHRIEHSMLE